MPRHSARRRSASRRQLSSDQTVQLLENRCLLTSLTPDLFQVSSIGDYGPFVVSEPQNATIPYANHQARFDQTQRYQTFGRNQVKISDEYFAVVPGQKIGLRGWAKSGDEFNLRFVPDNQQSFGVVAYDADYLQISPEHVLKHENSADTNLTAALRPGDTSFTVADATEWSTTADPATRSLAWYGYSNSHGQTYADYRYTRNVASDATIGLWSVSGIDNVSGVITLNEPWAGPLLPSGTAVRNATGGPDHSSIALNKEAVEGDFTYRQFEALIDGIDDGSGIHRKSHLPAGSRFLKVIIQSNQHGELNNQITWREIELLNLEFNATTDDLIQPNVESFSSADSPIMESDRFDYSLRVAELARSNAFVEVQADQRYRIVAAMMDISETRERPIGIESYDADHLLIHSLHVSRFADAVDTRLSRDLRPGDTHVFLNDATGWSNSVGATAESRSLAWYGYKSFEGVIYPDYTYTRNVASHLIDGMWNPGAVQFDDASGQWSIQLSAPWTGSNVSAGTALRNATGHDHLQRFNITTDYTFNPVERDSEQRRFRYIADFGAGVWQDGIPDQLTFRPGTAYVKAAVYNYARFGDDWLRLGPVSSFSVADQQTATFHQESYFSTGDSGHSFQSDQSFVVNTDDTYVISADFASGQTIDGTVSTSETHSLGYYAFDSDNQPVLPQHVQRYATATDTRLTAPLSPGDQVIRLNDATGWSNSDVPSTRTLAWYGYVNSEGDQYPDYTYTRNVASDGAFGLWDLGAISGNQIALRTPWSGPRVPAGTAVRNAVEGDTHFAAIQHSEVVANQWTTTQVSVSGEWQHGILERNSFPPGTAAVRLGGRANETRFHTDDVLHVRHMTIAAARQVTETGSNSQVVLELDVLTNDPDWEQLNLVDVGVPAFGAVTILHGEGKYEQDILRYTVAENFVGTDGLSYTAQHTVTGELMTTTVLITVNGLNPEQSPSIAQAILQQASSPEENNSGPMPSLVGPRLQLQHHHAESGYWLSADDQPTPSLQSFSEDKDDDTVAFRLVSGVAHGVLNFHIDGTFQYRSTSGFSGVDGFEYEVTDGLRGEKIAAWIHVSQPTETLAAERLGRIGEALLLYDNGRFPYDSNKPEQYDENGNPLLSWRVHILSELGYPDLYSRFRLDEPWDSPNNLPLLSQMPDIFRDLEASRESSDTRYQLIADFENPRSPFLVTREGKFLEMGSRRSAYGRTPNSILVSKVAEHLAAPWTAPLDVQFDSDLPLSAFSTDESHIQIYTFDGYVRTIRRDNISSEELTALIKLSRDEVVDVATLERRSRQSTSEPTPAASRILPIPDPFQAAQVGLSGFQDILRRWPLIDVPRYFDQNGHPLLSWRVHLLPYIGMRPLYEQFHLDEPWDSEHNLPLAQQMPEAFRSADDRWDSTSTRVQVLTGSEAPFLNTTTNGLYLGPEFRDIDDGTPETIAIVEAAPDQAVPWTAPLDIAFDPSQPLKAFGDFDSGEIQAAPFHWRSFLLSADLSPEDFSAMVTHQGDELPAISRLKAIEERRRGTLVSGYGKSNRLQAIDEYHRLRAISFGMLHYCQIEGSLPVDPENARYTGYFGDDGRPQLSWRVHILPYMGEEVLFSRFNLDEPWNSENNLPLLDEMPAIFRHPDDPHDSHRTRLQTFDGSNSSWIFSRSSGLLTPVKDASDTSAYTILAVETGPEVAVEWTKPNDVEFDPQRLHEFLGTLPGDILSFVATNGQFKQLKLTVQEALVAAMVTPNGGEDINSPYLTGSILAGISSTPLNTERLLITEDKLGTIDVVLNKPGDVTLQLNLSDTGIVSPDKTTLHFTQDTWNIPQTITFLAADDSVIDDPEITTATISVVKEASNDEFDDLPDIVIPIYNINDDVPPSFHIVSPANDEHLVEGQSSPVYRVVVLGQPTGNVTFQLTSNDASEAAPVPSLISVTPETADQVHTFVLEAKHDGIVDGDQAAAITVSVVKNQSGGLYDHLSDWIVPVVVSDIDRGMVTIGDVQVREAAFGNPVARVPVTLDKTVESSVSVGFTTADDSAMGGSDYESNSGHVVFDANSAAGSVQFIDIPIIDDRRYETDESFHVQLTTVESNGTDVQIQQEPAVITIVDNDLRGIYVSDTFGQATETGGTASFHVRLRSQPSDTVTIDVASSDETEGLPRSSTLTFNSDNWAILQTVIVDGVTDSIRDGDQDFQLILSPAVGGDYDGLDANDVGLTNLDTFVIPDVILSVQASALEGETVTATVSLSEAPSGPVEVSYRISADTADAADYSAGTGHLIFSPDSPLTQQFELTVIDDDLVEVTETFLVRLTDVQNGIVVEDEQSVSIIDNDQPAVSVLEANVTEGSVAHFTISLDQHPVANVQVVVSTAAGTATPSQDYIPIESEVITFRPDDWLTRVVEVATINDTVIEPGLAETFQLRIVDVVGANLTVGSATGTIRDNDIPVRPVLATVDRFPNTNQPTFTWPAIPGAIDYDVWLSRIFPSTSRIHADVSRVSQPQFSPPDELTPGYYKIWVRARGEHGNGGWSFVRHFEIRPNVIGPTGPTFDQRPLFEWNAIDHASAYEIYVASVSGNHVFKAIEGTSFRPANNLGQILRWWVRPASSIGNRGYSSATQVGTQTYLTEISGSEITWNAVGNAGRYVVQILNTDTRQTVVRETQATGTSLSLNPPLPEGNYKGWIKAVDQETDDFASGQWSKPFYSIVNNQGTNDPLPSLDVSILAPTVEVGDARPLFRWTPAAGADRYQVFVNTLDGQTILNEHTTESEFRSEKLFNNGRYRAWIRAISDTGRVGEWSAVHLFSVEIALSSAEADESKDRLLALVDQTESPQRNSAMERKSDRLNEEPTETPVPNLAAAKNRNEVLNSSHKVDDSTSSSTFHWLRDWVSHQS